jgi:thiol-disulfide isomerase/thioredoxin
MRINLSKILFTFFLLGFFSDSNAQEKEYETLDLNPQPIRQGQIVRLKLKTEKTDLGNSKGEVYAIMLAYQSGEPSISDTVMRLDKKTLTASFRIPAGTDAVAFKFMRGAMQIDNNGNGYFFPVADSNDNQQANTYFSLYKLQSNDSRAGITKGNATLAKRYFDKWFETQDYKKFSFYDKAVYLFMRKDTLGLCQHFTKIASYPDIPEGKLQNLKFYVRLCGQAVSNSLDAEIKRRFPEGNWYWSRWYDSLRVLKTPAEKFAWVKAFSMAFPQDTLKEIPIAVSMYSQIMNSSIKSLDWDVMKSAASYVEANNTITDRYLSIYNSFMDEALRKDTLVKELLPKAQHFYKLAQQNFESNELPPYEGSKYLYRLEKMKALYNSASTYGAFLHKSGFSDSASILTEPAARLYNWKSPLYNERYFVAAEKIKPASALIPLMEQAFRNEGYSLLMKDIYVRVYNKLGKGDGVTALHNLLSEQTVKLKTELKGKMKSEKAPDFELPGLNGGKTSLAALRGKVILIDFWATWCGPCIASFPAMQQLVNQNKKREDVAILFVDTWQKESDKFETVRQFFRENRYSFDVYMDLQDQAVKNFKVAGIPTKIIIDKNGIIRFVSVGYNSDEVKSVEELQSMIDMASQL